MSKLETLEKNPEELYRSHPKPLLFHGWHHITFVKKKSAEFANALGIEAEIVQAAALVHDLNYLVAVNSWPHIGADVRRKALQEAGYTSEEFEHIESIVMEAHTATRGRAITKEGMALSDADTLFKALPITPIVLASKYLEEASVDIATLTEKIISEQQPLMDQGIYFYTDLAKSRYLHWAQQNLAQWRNVQECLREQDVRDLLDQI